MTWMTSSAPTGFVFTNTRGDPIKPDRLGELFHRLVQDADLPAIRLHDLRDGAASLSLAAGNDLKIVQTMLRSYGINAGMARIKPTRHSNPESTACKTGSPTRWPSVAVHVLTLGAGTNGAAA
jgi:integrase